MNYARAIRIARAAYGISQKELAHDSGLDASYVSLLEKGTRTPSTSAVDSLASAMNIPSDLLKLLAAEEPNLKGISPQRAAILGNELLHLLTSSGSDHEGP